MIVDMRLDDRPTAGDHGPDRTNGPQEWSAEPTTETRVQKGLGGTFNLGKDGRGNPLSAEKRKRLGRMRRLDKRMDDREKRLNEAMRDAELIGENVGLPGYVIDRAARVLREVADARLPAGRMSWDALAAGAVLLCARDAGLERDTREIAQYAKTSHERVCAGARKVRVELDLDVPPARAGCVASVLDELGAEMPDEAAGQLGRLARHLLDLADKASIGVGTPRHTMAAAALYAADRLTPGKHLIQAEAADAGGAVVEMSQSRIKRYSMRLHDAFQMHHGVESVTLEPSLAG